MAFFEALILGLVQGLGEFLPISSSGHLVLFQNIFGMEGDMLLLDTLLHLATLVAVCIVLWPEIMAILRRPFGKMTWLLVVATLPAVFAALFLEDAIEAAFGGEWLGWGFVVTAVLMAFVGRMPGVTTLRDRLQPKARWLLPVLGCAAAAVMTLLVAPAAAAAFGSAWLAWLFLSVLFILVLMVPMPQHTRGEITYPRAAVMGVLQAVAIMPGISRSGSTLAGGLMTGAERQKATRFAFLMSIPAILGSLVFQLKDVVEVGVSASLGGMGVLPLAAGMVMALVAGVVSLKWMLRLVSNGKLWCFGVYVMVLALLVLLDQSWWHWVF